MVANLGAAHAGEKFLAQFVQAPFRLADEWAI
jgi:hypothetical protein